MQPENSIICELTHVLAKRVIVQMYVEIHWNDSRDNISLFALYKYRKFKEMHLTYAHAPNLCRNQIQTLNKVIF